MIRINLKPWILKNTGVIGWTVEIIFQIYGKKIKKMTVKFLLFKSTFFSCRNIINLIL